MQGPYSGARTAAARTRATLLRQAEPGRGTRYGPELVWPNVVKLGRDRAPARRAQYGPERVWPELLLTTTTIVATGYWIGTQ